jgi:hypothetical protein
MCPVWAHPDPTAHRELVIPDQFECVANSPKLKLRPVNHEVVNFWKVKQRGDSSYAINQKNRCS